MTNLLFRLRYPLVSSLALVLLMVTSPGMAGDLVQATTDGDLYLLGGGERARLGRVGAVEEALNLPAGTRIYDLAATIDGWVATGSLPDDDGYDLVIVQDRAGVRELLAPPTERWGRFRVQVVTLVEEGNLAGIAWVEGDSQADFEVRAAVWDGANFGPAEVVSPVGPGAQLALEGAVLDDGSWLLVWAAVDGEDDEILWSVRRQEEWSAPARVHQDNSVPDITPALVAIDGGALAAWSYPPTWTLTEIDRTGTMIRRAVWSGDVVERPLVLAGDEVEAAFRWPQGAEGLEADREWRVRWEDEF
jgi:hypothetical protein